MAESSSDFMSEDDECSTPPGTQAPRPLPGSQRSRGVGGGALSGGAEALTEQEATHLLTAMWALHLWPFGSSATEEATCSAKGASEVLLVLKSKKNAKDEFAQAREPMWKALQRTYESNFGKQLLTDGALDISSVFTKRDKATNKCHNAWRDVFGLRVAELQVQVGAEEAAVDVEGETAAAHEEEHAHARGPKKKPKHEKGRPLAALLKDPSVKGPHKGLLAIVEEVLQAVKQPHAVGSHSTQTHQPPHHLPAPPLPHTPPFL